MINIDNELLEITSTLDSTLDLIKKLPKLKKGESNYVIYSSDPKRRNDVIFDGSLEELCGVWACRAIADEKYRELDIKDALVSVTKEIAGRIEKPVNMLNIPFEALRIYNQAFLKTARRFLDYNQDQMAEELGWCKQQISNLEKGARDLQYQTKLAIETILRRADKWDDFCIIFHVHKECGK